MTDKAMFWTVVKADAIFALISITLSIVLTVVLALWRKRRNRKLAGTIPKIQGPRAIIVGGKEPKPGECPLCGREWPLPGPRPALDHPFTRKD